MNARFTPPAQAKPESHPVNRESQWRNLTEDLIFASAYYDDQRTGSITWRRCLDARNIKHNQQDEDRKCRELCAAINALSPKLGSQIERAHAANDHPTFRLQHGDLFPARMA